MIEQAKENLEKMENTLFPEAPIYIPDWIDNSIGFLVLAMGICLGIVISTKFL